MLKRITSLLIKFLEKAGFYTEKIDAYSLNTDVHETPLIKWLRKTNDYSLNTGEHKTPFITWLEKTDFIDGYLFNTDQTPLVGWLGVVNDYPFHTDQTPFIQYLEISNDFSSDSDSLPFVL